MPILRNPDIDRSTGHAAALRSLIHFAYRIYCRAKRIDGPYGPITPNATYSPWLADSSFLEVYEKIKGHTMVNILMCYGLWSMVEQCAKLSGGALMEVGVWRGGTGGLIAKAAEINGIKDNVYLCDNFEGLVKVGSKDWFFKGGELKDTSEALVSDLVHKKLALKNVKLLKGIFPDETAHLVTDRKFRFCHIDVVLYESGKDIVDWIWDKMVAGGVLVFDDYGFRHCSGITRLVDERKHHDDAFYIYNLCGHGILVKR